MGCSNYSKKGVDIIYSSAPIKPKSSGLHSGNSKFYIKENIGRDPAPRCKSTVSLNNSGQSSTSDRFKETGEIINQLAEKPLYENFDENLKLGSPTETKLRNTAINWESESLKSLHYYFYGLNSEEIGSTIFKLFVAHELMIDCNNKYCIKGSDSTTKISCFKCSSYGLTLLSSICLQSKSMINSDNFISYNRLNSIISKIICDGQQPKLNDNISKHSDLTRSSLTEVFHVCLFSVDSLEAANTFDTKFPNEKSFIILTFDYFDKPSFDSLIQSLNNIVSKIKMMGIGAKSKPSIGGDDAPEKNYEVNEDFARIALSILGINCLTINTKEIDLLRLSRVEADTKASSRKASNSFRDQYSLEMKLFDFIFNF